MYDVGEIEGHPFIVSAYLAGENLAEAIPKNGLSVSTAIEYAIQIGEGLQAAHQLGIIHRDMKPGNVILASDAEGNVRAKIIDFGLTQIGGASKLTEPGQLLGTAAYICPEILQGKPVDRRADIWSLGVMLYEMLSGRAAFDAENRERLFYVICHEQAEPLTALCPNLPEEAARIVARALEKDRTLRYQHVSEICFDLRRLKRDLKSSDTVIVPETGDDRGFAPIGGVSSAANAKAAGGKSGAAAVPAQPEATGASARRLWNVGAVALAGILVVLGLVSWYGWRQTAQEPEISRRRLTTSSSEVPVTAAAISPDGKYLAYADDTGIYVRVIETGEKHFLSTVSSGFATSTLSWFPDGIRLAATGTVAEETTSSIWALSILGGAAHKLRDDARGASVSPNGAQIAFLNGNATEI